MPRFKVVIVDRPAWYLPTLEREVLAEVDAEVVVGWARLNAPHQPEPAVASLGLSAAELSRISVSYVPAAEHTEDILAEMADDADAIVASTARISAGLLDRLPRLRVIGRPGIGYDVADIDAATARGIPVFNAPGFWRTRSQITPSCAPWRWPASWARCTTPCGAASGGGDWPAPCRQPPR